MLEDVTAVDSCRQVFPFERSSLESIRRWIVAAVGGLDVLPATDLDPLGAAVCHTLNIALAPGAPEGRCLRIEVDRDEDLISVRVVFVEAAPDGSSHLIVYRRGSAK